MLKGVPRIIPPELLKILAQMGHGDELVISDAHFPAHSISSNVVRADAVGSPEMMKAILKLIELDQYVDKPVMLMEPVPGDTIDPDLLAEINEIKAACKGKILKVIIETCLLTDEEKVKMTEIVSESKADYIKTSTGFSTAGATRHDVEIFAAHVTNGTLIKAAGGISSIADAEDFINLGASRLGTSRIVKIVKTGEQNKGDTSY